MVRSMYAGVSGMKAHQTRMDAIGNNISNVNTYGFKSSRATFRDSYYQAMRGAAAATGSRGGINPAEIGYGSQTASVDVLQSQSTLSNTGYALDCAIVGEGFFQVQDPDGNIFFTRAGMFDFDSLGNLVDSNGNFVLGVSGKPLGKGADKQKIQVNLPAVNPAASSATEPINNINYTIKGSKNTEDGNVLFTIMADSSLPDGKPAKAVLTNSGVTITLNAKHVFENLTAVEEAINAAIITANDGKEHPGGHFSISADPDINTSKFGTTGLTGAEVVEDNFGIKLGSVPTKEIGGKDIFGLSFDSAEPGFTADDGEVKYKIEYKQVDGKNGFVVTATIGTGAGTPYSGFVPLTSIIKGAGGVLMKKGADPLTGEESDAFTLNYPSLTSLINKSTDDDGRKALDNVSDTTNLEEVTTALAAATANLKWDETAVRAGDKTVASKPSNDLGLGSKGFSLKGGTEGGAQSIKDLEGISIGADGVITASHAILGQVEIGRLDLCVFNNAAGLTQTGNTYYSPSPNSGEPELVKPGLSGAGAIKNSALEQSNVDLSQEFSDMIVTQRGFQANSRLITVSDTMLEELINLKR